MSRGTETACAAPDRRQLLSVEFCEVGQGVEAFCGFPWRGGVVVSCGGQVVIQVRLLRGCVIF